MAWCLNTLSLDKDILILYLNEKRVSVVSIFFKYIITEIGIPLYLSFSKRNKESMIVDFIENFQRKENIIALLRNYEILCKGICFYNPRAQAVPLIVW